MRIWNGWDAGMEWRGMLTVNSGPGMVWAAKPPGPRTTPVSRPKADGGLEEDVEGVPGPMVLWGGQGYLGGFVVTFIARFIFDTLSARPRPQSLLGSSGPFLPSALSNIYTEKEGKGNRRLGWERGCQK